MQTESNTALPEPRAPRWGEMAACYGVTQAALIKMAKKYHLTIHDCVMPENVRDALLKYGDRRGVLIRRLSNPEMLESIGWDILELEFHPQ